MTLKQVLALLGTALTMGGVFMPIASVGGYSTNFFMGGSGMGLIVAILAVASVITAMASFYKILWITGIGALGLVTYSAFTFDAVLFNMVTAPGADLIAATREVTLADVTYEISAWIMLFLGSTAILVSAIVYLPEDDEDEE